MILRRGVGTGRADERHAGRVGGGYAHEQDWATADTVGDPASRGLPEKTGKAIDGERVAGERWRRAQLLGQVLLHQRQEEDAQGGVPEKEGDDELRELELSRSKPVADRSHHAELLATPVCVYL